MKLNIPEFQNPSWISEQTASAIQKKMMDNLPEGLDKTEGGFPWDMTRPTAIEISETLQFNLSIGLRQTYSLWATGAWLDLHGLEVDLTRKQPEYAYGVLSIEGQAGIEIPVGFMFSTRGTAEKASLYYMALEAVTLDDEGKADVHIRAENTGAEYNTPEDTVCLMVQPINGIETITNKDVVTGGADLESDDDFRLRIIQAERNGSMTGCDADYIRWAMEVPGVSSAMVEPLWNGNGTVRVIVADAEGNMANTELTQRVYDYIVSPNDRSKRKAPIGATVTVDSVRFYDIDIRFAFTVIPGADPERISEMFRESILEYFAEDAREDMAVSYNRIRAFLEGREGVKTLTRLDIRPADNPEAKPLEPAEFLAIPIGYYPDVGVFERTEE